MSLHTRKIGPFLSFEHLDRSQHLVEVLCPGYRFTDEPGERWTAFVNRVKANNSTAIERAATVLKGAVDKIQLPRNPVLVVPILGSHDTSTKTSSAVSRLAAAIGELDGFTYCPALLRKTAHRSLHNLRSASSRDAEVEDKYKSRRFAEIGVGSVGCVLLVDDLVTRGTTMNDAARAIRAANGKVSMYGVALGKSERRGYWGGQINNDHLSRGILEAAGLA